MLHFNSILEVEKEVLVLENVAERNYKQTLIYILHIKNRATQAHKWRMDFKKSFSLNSK